MTGPRAPHGAYVPPETARAAATAGLRERFGVPVWWGAHTRSWWAYLPTGARGCLVEATTPQELADAIICAATTARDGRR